MRNGAPRRKGPTSMTDGRKGAFGVEGADVGLGLRPKNIGARVKRVEDPRLLTGQGSERVAVDEAAVKAAVARERLKAAAAAVAALETEVATSSGHGDDPNHPLRGRLGEILV